MKETERSLRAYFIIVGVIAMLLALRDFRDTAALPAGLISAKMSLSLWIPSVARLVLGVGYLVAGIRLPQALRGDPTWIVRLLQASIIVLFADLAIVYALAGMFVTILVIQGVIGTLLAIYLIANVKRLSAAARATMMPAPLPYARTF
jgi:hypothetical protein